MSPAAGWIIDTDVTAETTLGRMAKLARRAMLDPNVIYVSNQIVAPAAARDVVAQIESIYDFMDSSFSFVPNPIGTQTIRPPGWTGRQLAPGMLEDVGARGFTQGACDDAAVLIATIGMANGIPARFRAIELSDDPGAYTHVVADLYDGAHWRELDVTRPDDRAQLTDDDVVKSLVYNVS